MPAHGAGIEIEILRTGDRYAVQSSFSYPLSPTMGQNLLAVRPWSNGESAWQPAISRESGAVVVTAEGASYRLERRIRVEGRRITVTDRITNKTAAVLGLAITHSLMSAGQPAHVRLNGLDPGDPSSPTPSAGQFPENPTVFVALPRSGVGLLVEDDALRLQSAASTSGNQASLTTQMLGIPRGERHDMRWALYPTGPDYFELVQEVRRDWKVNFTVQGSCDFFDVRTLGTPEGREAVRRLLERKRMDLFALTPWFEYYNYWGLDRPKYSALMLKAMDFLRGIAPQAKFLACVATNLTPVPLSFFGDTIPPGYPIGRQNGGQYGQPASTRMSHRIDNSVWRDSVIRAPSGQVLLDAWHVQHYNHPPALNLMVYPTVHNHRQAQALDQFHFLLDEVGFDGLYIDQFSMAYNCLANGATDRYTYDRWDDRTVTLDAAGNVTAQFADLALLTAPARRSWLDLLLASDKIAVCNTCAAVSHLQRLPVLRFMETHGYEPLAGAAPYQWRMAKGQLGSPIGLSSNYRELTWPGAEAWNRTVIAGLRFGLLSYYSWTDFPAAGPFGGEYGPVNHMFPFTPRELHEGWVLGEERLITCVSGDFRWPHSREPRVLQFDRVGRPRAAEADVQPEGDGYRIRIRLNDWWEIAVAE